MNNTTIENIGRVLQPYLKNWKNDKEFRREILSGIGAGLIPELEPCTCVGFTDREFLRGPYFGIILYVPGYGDVWYYLNSFDDIRHILI